MIGRAKRLIYLPTDSGVTTCKPSTPLVTCRTMKNQGCWTKFIKIFGNEIAWDKFSLEHYPMEDFCKSQWQQRSRSFWWLLYRWLVAAFFIAALVATGIHLFDNFRFFVYLTDWGFILDTVALTYGAVLTTMWHFGKVDRMEHPLAIKVFWVLHYSALVLAVIITVMFWTLLYPMEPEFGKDPYNYLQHACNAIFMVLDHMLVAFPTRFLHFVYPLGIGAVYALFSLIYYLCGGTGVLGASFIYPILDWGESPGIAVCSVLLAVVLSMVFSFLLFWLYKLRIYLYETFSQAPNPHSIPY